MGVHITGLGLRTRAEASTLLTTFWVARMVNCIFSMLGLC